jgi:SAM-dependent methyltransferase
MSDPLTRFSGLAEIYARCRPDYPGEAIDDIVRTCGLARDSVVVDVGCGTGISSRLFAARGFTVIGVEPNADMRRQAESSDGERRGVSPPCPDVTYGDGTAEATGLPDACARVVVAAQAFHWFRPEPALREFHRILVAGGWVALMWNERDDTDLFTAAVSAVIRTAPRAEQIEGPRRQAGEAIFHSPLFQKTERRVFRHEQIVDEEGLIGRAFSASYAPREPAAAEAFAAGLRDAFARFQQGGKAALRYETSVYFGQKS